MRAIKVITDKAKNTERMSGTTAECVHSPSDPNDPSQDDATYFFGRTLKSSGFYWIRQTRGAHWLDTLLRMTARANG
jgi:hypothetical protein